MVGSVPQGDIGRASGSFSMILQVGVAILAAVFAAAGSYNSAAAFSAGFGPALAAAAGLALVGALAGLALPGRPGQARQASAERTAASAERTATAHRAGTADMATAGR